MDRRTLSVTMTVICCNYKGSAMHNFFDMVGSSAKRLVASSEERFETLQKSCHKHDLEGAPSFVYGQKRKSWARVLSTGMYLNYECFMILVDTFNDCEWYTRT